MEEPNEETLLATTEGVIQSLLPFGEDNNKGRYIGYRASGFTFREACQLTGIHYKSIYRWRETDEKFKEWEDQLPELRKTLGIEYSHLEFIRNYRLILQKDYEIISKSLKAPEELDNKEHQYLLKLRSHYTPQQLQVLQSLIGAGGQDKPFDFNNFIVTLRRSEEVKIQGGVMTDASQVD